MPRLAFLRTGMRAILASVVLTCLFASGVAAGLWFYPQLSATTIEDHDHHDDHASEMHEDDHDEEDHVALTKQAFENLGLRMGTPKTGDYWKSMLVPGRVVEIPGRSDLTVSTLVAGVLDSVNVIPGQNLPAQKPLFTIRLTDEALLAAQAKYLEILTQVEVAQQEITRLAPLIKTGAVSGAKKRELEYEVKQLVARQATILQELRGRGLPADQVEQLRRDRTLISTFSVFAPKFVQENNAGKQSNGYSLENLLVHPGKAVSRGDSLCTVAYHRKLYIEGTAFEVDLPLLDQIAKKEWKITADTIDGEHNDSESTSMLLKLLRVDNHIDEGTQTVRFFVELPNEVTQTLTKDGRQFEQWRFRPGQRLHLRLPVKQYTRQIILPSDAVVVDGPNVFVFVEHDHVEHDHEEHEKQEHKEQSKDEQNIFIELEPVPVRLLHRDDKFVVIANDGQLHDDERVALNNAYKLYLAMKMKGGGGGGHHHHDH